MGWIKLTTTRSELGRAGLTFGKDFSTVRAVRFIANADISQGESTEVRFSDTEILGGPITSQVQYCYIYVRDDGVYIAKSGPSDIMEKISLEAQGAVIQIPADASRDSQVNKIWLFRRGRTLGGAFYRVAAVDVSGTGAVTINDELSDADALIVNIRLEGDNERPPVNIIGIEGPYYDRLFALTATHLYPSRRLNPESFSAGQVILIAGADERALWVRKAIGGLYVGTTKDIYRISGTGAELPDGTMDFLKQPLNIDTPPISESVAQDGNLLVYLAADGWRTISGGGSELLTRGTSLLYHGKARHGVSAINIATGRFRAAIVGGQLSAITPEGESFTSAKTIYQYRFSNDHWYRHVYSRYWRSIIRAPGGILLAGDIFGFVWRLDAGTLDQGENIPVEMRTRDDDLGEPFARKDPQDLRILVNTGGAQGLIELYFDHFYPIASSALQFSRSWVGERVFNISDNFSFNHIQMKLTGSFPAFNWAGYKIGYATHPLTTNGEMPASDFGYPGVKTISAIQMRVGTFGQPRIFTPIVDGIAYPPFTVTSGPDDPVNYTHAFYSDAVHAVELGLAVDGNIEMYSWTPLITAKRPLGIKVWDSGPLDLGTRETIWPRELWMKVEATADLSVSLFFDNILLGTVTAEIEGISITKVRIPLPRGYKGKVPRFIIRSTEPFYPYWFEFVRRETGDVSEKKPIRVDAGFGGQVAL